MAFRLALPTDLVKLQKLDSEVFPEGSKDLEPASEAELQGGVANGDVWLIEEGSAVQGFFQLEKVSDSKFSLISLAVASKFQGSGIGKRLLDEAIMLASKASVDAEIVCVTSPKNLRMIGLLVSHSFIAVQLVEDYFGAGKDRVWLRRGANHNEYPETRNVIVPLHDSKALTKLMAERGMHIVKMLNTAQGRNAVMCLPIEHDPVSLRQTEANSSVGQASGILAALTFILAFAFSSANSAGFGSTLGLFLIVCIILVVGAVQVYANSTGNMARIGDGNFDDHMKWGNLLLDFGGHYPLVLILPALFAEHGTLINTLVVGLAVTLALAAYEISPFAIRRRYRKSKWNSLLVILTCAVPLFSFTLVSHPEREIYWLLAVVILLGLRFVWQVDKSNTEKLRAKN